MSKRKYKVAISDSVGITVEHVTLNTLMNDGAEYEYIFAMREIMDEILDLKVNEALYFRPNRDDKTTKGIVHRVE